MQPSDLDLEERIAAASDPSDAFTALPRDRWRRVFFSLTEDVAERVVEGMGRHELESLVAGLDPDEVTDVLGYADTETREALLATLDGRRREKIEFLLSFDPETAAGLMNVDYVTVDVESEFTEVEERVRRFQDKTGRVPTVLVTSDGDLLGELPGAVLSVADPEVDVVEDYVQETPSVRYDRGDEDVLQVFRENRERKIAVLDEAGDVLGVIHADDLLDVVDQTRGETLYEFTGVAEEESVLDGPRVKIRRRYRWLILNLATAFMAAAVVGVFEATITAVAILAAYMPVVAGMGGNAGTQSMAVTVRGISLGQVSLSTGRRVILNEVVAGAVNGFITGALVAVIATAFSYGEFGVLLGAVIGVSMIANLVIAGFFGALTPLVLDRVGYDPATSATIFITTATDVLGFLVFLGLARAVLV
ncbi:MAG: magnesium transporter [Halobacteriales archaeon]